MKYVYFGGWLDELERLNGESRVIILCDSNVLGLYSDYLEGYSTIEFEALECNKTLQSVEGIYCELRRLEVDRSATLVVIGGGITTDIGGYVASTYLRGINFCYIPTTLLAQIDAAIGGKCGVNLDGYKNLIGTFSLPKKVIIDSLFLKTLPQRELRSAFGEVIKYAVLRGKDILYSSDYIERCVSIKLEIVENDFRESGQRKLLNLGHTFAHAVEKCTTQYNHGEAVAIGIATAARISHNIGYLSYEIKEEIVNTISQFSLPNTLPLELDTQSLLDAIKYDKKRRDGKVEMVLIRNFGECFTQLLSINEIRDSLL